MVAVVWTLVRAEGTVLGFGEGAVETLIPFAMLVVGMAVEEGIVLAVLLEGT